MKLAKHMRDKAGSKAKAALEAITKVLAAAEL